MLLYIWSRTYLQSHRVIFLCCHRLPRQSHHNTLGLQGFRLDQGSGYEHADTTLYLTQRLCSRWVSSLSWHVHNQKLEDNGLVCTLCKLRNVRSHCGTGGAAPVPVAILVFGVGGKNSGMYVCRLLAHLSQHPSSYYVPRQLP